MSEHANGRCLVRKCAATSAQRRRGPVTRRARGVRKQYIDPQKFINKAAPIAEEVPYRPSHEFTDFPFSAELQHAIRQKGFSKPSAIQDQAIPAILRGDDVIGLANTGTGKTAAFLLPIIERMSGIMARPSVLIMAPTRELAQQINDEFRVFAKGLGLHSALLVGGVAVDRQLRDLKRRPHFIIGTPGRLKDLLVKKQLRLADVSVLVLDEADQMLDMGFLPDITAIMKYVPTTRQSLFFSATMTAEIKTLTDTLLKDPVTISVRTSETSDHVAQDVIVARDKAHKIELLQGLLDRAECEKALVFGETKYGVQRLSSLLCKAGYASVAIHGNKTQAQRQRALREFKEEKATVLVATDVAARGLDIPNVTHVINFDTPQTYEDYIHRIGRTGRGGARGQAHTFIDKDLQKKQKNSDFCDKS